MVRVTVRRLSMTSDQDQESYGHDPYTCKRSGSKVTWTKVRLETDGQTDRRTEAIALPPVLTRSR